MGFTPRDVDKMSLWEFTACYDGYRAVNGIKSEKTISDDRLRDMGIEGF